eukprot:3545592-Lingulodinium_polyedra.AAC.1
MACLRCGPGHRPRFAQRTAFRPAVVGRQCVCFAPVCRVPCPFSEIRARCGCAPCDGAPPRTVAQ